MLLLDLSQIAIAAITQSIGVKGGFQPGEFDEFLTRHMILNSIRANVRKFKGDYGPEIIIACDSRASWRREIFPYYKMHRKVAQAKSYLNWEQIFRNLNNCKDVLKEHSPYKVLEVDGAEADDIIAVLCEMEGNRVPALCSGPNKILILSGDKDFRQLQKLEWVGQFNPRSKEFIEEDMPLQFLKEQIIHGDASDGIPNILSDDAVFVTPELRQVPITAKRLAKFASIDPTKYPEKAKRGWDRNEALIDLSKIPETIQEKILATYREAKGNPKVKLLNYLITLKHGQLAEAISDF